MGLPDLGASREKAHQMALPVTGRPTWTQHDVTEKTLTRATSICLLVLFVLHPSCVWP